MYLFAHGVLQVENGAVGSGEAVVELEELLEVDVVALGEPQLLQHAPGSAKTSVHTQRGI